MGNEEVGEAQLFLKVFEQVYDLGLNGDIQGRDGFVADDEFGHGGQGAGNADALALPTGEFVRVAVHKFGVELHQFEEFGNLLHARFALGDLVYPQGFGDDAGDGPTRVEGGIGAVSYTHLTLPTSDLV